MSERENILELKNVVYSFHTYGGEVKAVRDVSYEVRQGEILGIVGESGCGKSVTAQCILRLNPEPPGFFEGGEILYKGQDVSKKEVKERAMDIMRLVGISDVEKRYRQYPHELSGGMKQRVMIAIALVSRPSVIICDEPTTSLDVTIEAQILDLLLELREKLGTSIIMITHDLGVISRLCDRVVVMYGGKVVEKGEIGEIFYNTAHPYTKGLMQSIAKLDTAKGEKLKPIEGTPPDLFAPPKGCPFAARCEYCMDVCEQFPPEAYQVSDDHITFCWLQHEMAPETDLKKATAKKGEV